MELREDLAAFVARIHPAKIVAAGYAFYMLVGWLLLSLPISSAGDAINSIDALFTSASAVSTTGLVTKSTGNDFSLFGQIVILTLIQLGGIGYMTFGSFVLLSRGASLSSTRTHIGKTVFALPISFRIDKFIRSVVVFTAAVEAAGAIALYFVFRSHGMPDPFWSAVFHSVSAFCTAGFSLYDNSFESFRGDFWLNIVIGSLSYLGAMGFIVAVDFWLHVRNKAASLTLTSRIILWSTLWLSVMGTVLLFVTEPSIQTEQPPTRLLAAFFQSMTAITTVGFNTVNISVISKASLLLIVILMVVGASPAGTGGGLKSTTFSALLALMRSALKGGEQVTFWGRVVPIRRIWTAAATLGFYLFALLIGTYLLELTEPSQFDRVIFEAASALGTVGLSTGITPQLTALGKLIIVLLMYCGRLGPLTFGLALFSGRAAYMREKNVVDDVAV